MSTRFKFSGKNTCEIVNDIKYSPKYQNLKSIPMKYTVWLLDGQVNKPMGSKDQERDRKTETIVEEYDCEGTNELEWRRRLSIAPKHKFVCFTGYADTQDLNEYDRNHPGLYTFTLAKRMKVRPYKWNRTKLSETEPKSNEIKWIKKKICKHFYGKVCL